MKLPLLLSTTIALSACQVMPDLSDTTPATLRFSVHYLAPGLATPKVEITTTTSIHANRCLYVNEPFGVVANVRDNQGVESVYFNQSSYTGELIARNEEGDILAIPLPAEPTQNWWDDTIPNPGTVPDSALVSVRYSTTKAYKSMVLMGVYTFGENSHVALAATARNFNSASRVSQVWNFYVQKAESGNPERQAGMPCDLPRT